MPNGFTFDPKSPEHLLFSDIVKADEFKPSVQMTEEVLLKRIARYKVKLTPQQEAALKTHIRTVLSALVAHWYINGWNRVAGPDVAEFGFESLHIENNNHEE